MEDFDHSGSVTIVFFCCSQQYPHPPNYCHQVFFVVVNSNIVFFYCPQQYPRPPNYCHQVTARTHPSYSAKNKQGTLPISFFSPVLFLSFRPEIWGGGGGGGGAWGVLLHRQGGGFRYPEHKSVCLLHRQRFPFSQPTVGGLRTVVFLISFYGIIMQLFFSLPNICCFTTGIDWFRSLTNEECLTESWT